MTGQIILNFHGIGEPHGGVDAAERRYWINAGFFERILDFGMSHPAANRIVWTFDDGNQSDLTIGAPALMQRQLPGIFFLLTGRFNDPRYLSPTDAHSLRTMGMEIGLHGHDHLDWRRLDANRLEDETVNARKTLASVIGTPVDSVAIPFGAYDRKVIAHLKRCGYTRIYTSDGGHCRPTARICNRTSIRNDMSLDDVAALIAGWESILPQWRRATSTLVRRYLV